MEARDAFQRLGLTPEERRLFRAYTRNAIRRGLTEGCAVTVALHALDVCDKQIARVLEKKPKAINHAVARARERLDVRGKGALIRLIQVRPGARETARAKPDSGQRPFERARSGRSADPPDRNGD